MPKGQCRLCGMGCQLQLSHVIPAFVIRWVRESSGGGYLRHGAAPNQRVQDGLKRYWLCTACEGVFSRSETDFASNLFHPYINGKASRVLYNDWLLRFCVSLSWRVLQFYKEETSFKDYSPDILSRINDAEATWRSFLLGQRPHPAQYQQHILPVDAIESITTSSDLPSNLNRYLMRTIDMDLCRSDGANFVFSKLGRFIILGFIRLDRPNHWQGSKVRAKEGCVEPGRYTIPIEFFDYLMAKARLTSELLAGVSLRQVEKINEAFRKNVEKYVGTDEFNAMLNDIRMFGDAAFMSADMQGQKDKGNGESGRDFPSSNK